MRAAIPLPRRRAWRRTATRGEPLPGLRARQRRVHPVPLARPTATESNPGAILRLAGGLPRRFRPQRFLATGGAQAGRDYLHSFRRRHGAQESHAGERFLHQRNVPSWLTCFSCHDVHGTANNADLRRPTNEMCLQCHGPKSPNGPRAATIEQHTHHKAGSSGNECVGCHMPKIEPTIADVTSAPTLFDLSLPPGPTV